ncbi:MAG: protein kinase [Fimbriimonadia bacterium]|nr:protein kinase [Fimbriimonadia bacterium]
MIPVFITLPMSVDLVLGHYRIIREIARSNDIVYEALDTRMNRRVAVKELHLPAGVTDSARQDRIHRFQREARAAGQLTHPNIVTIYETEVDPDGRYFIVMEYLEGENLREKMLRDGVIPAEEAVGIATQVLEALTEAHSKGVIHRDIKPENIHLIGEGRVKLTDFGIARLKYEPTITMDGQIFGTPSYMSPEQVLGQEIDERTDLFSVGTVFYEMVAGFKPFTGDSVVSITYNIMNTEPPSPPDLPYALEWVIRRSLQKSPVNRFSSAQEMKKALADALESLKTPPVMLMPNTAGAPAPAYPPSQTYPAPGTMYPTAPSTTYPTGQTTTAAPPPAYIPPPPPPKPWLSAAAKSFLGTVFVVVLIGAAILGFLAVGAFSLQKAYERHEMEKRDEVLAADYQRAEKLHRQGQFLEAAQVYANTLARARSAKHQEMIQQNLAISLTAYGNQRLKVRDYTTAAQAYQSALRYRNLPGAYDGLALISAEQGDYEKALKHWAQAVDLAEGSEKSVYQQKAADLLFRLGDNAHTRGEVVSAMRFWQRVIELMPGTRQASEARDRIDKLLSSRFGNNP